MEKKKVLTALIIYALAFMAILPMTQMISAQATEITISSNSVSVDQATSPDYSFTTIDGTTVSATGSGKKATVLLFGQAGTCSNTYGAIQSISESDWVSSSNIRVIYVDINSNSTADDIRTIKKMYGCDEMIFCYGQENISRACYYLQLGGVDVSGGFSMPAVIILDENDEIKHATDGYMSAREILHAINLFYDSGYSECPVYEMPVCGTESYSYVKEVFDIVNANRKEKGLSELQLDQELMDAAMLRASELAYYYSHTRANGQDCFSLFPDGIYAAAENIAEGQVSPESVMTAWMNSTEHKKNILGDYNSIGIGCFITEDGRRHWVQCFAKKTVVTVSLPEDKKVEKTIDLLSDYLSIPTSKETTLHCETVTKIEITNYITNKIIPAKAFNYSSGNEAIAVVDTNGSVMFKDAGSVVINVSLKADEKKNFQYEITREGHDLYYTKKKEPTITLEGRQAYYTCYYCGTYFKDATGKTKITELSTLNIPKLPLKNNTNNNTDSDANEDEKDTAVKKPSKTPLAKGKKFTKSNGRYKVTSSSKTSPTVQYLYCKKKNATSVTIPSYVTYKNVKYKVTSIASKAFRNNKKIKKITIGSQVKTIGEKAFEGCTKLKSIKIQSKKIKKIGTKAFRKIHSKCVIKVPKSKLKYYKKIMKNKGQKKSVKIKNY